MGLATPNPLNAPLVAGPTAPVGAPRLYNLSAGPSMLPEEVLKQIQHDTWSIHNSGVGIFEHSHRGKVYDRVLGEAEADFRAIAKVPADYKVLFLTGGATSQNYMAPLNLKSYHQNAEYITTGYWAERSYEHAAMSYGKVHEAWSGKAENYRRIPRDEELRYEDGPTPAYVHMCSNNTIFGTQWHEKDAAGNPTYAQRVPRTPPGVPVVCDMCSDIYCRPVDFTKFGLVYAGAQKNLGVAGCTIVVIREDLMARRPLDRDGQERQIPLMLSYQVQARDESRHNTPPVGPIYIAGLMFKWILKEGGLGELWKRNIEKAGILYGAIDRTGFYRGHAEKSDRSLMNVLFRTPTPELDDRFVVEAGKAGFDALKGHRASGGMRASIYNAFPREGVVALAQFMAEFERRHG